MTADKLRALAERLRACLPTADDGPDHKVWCTVRGDDLREAVESIAAQPAQEPPVHQYYYKVDGCKAKQPVDYDCICWHNEGSGPCDGERHDAARPLVKWRSKTPNVRAKRGQTAQGEA